jgi:hypothetical protein
MKIFRRVIFGFDGDVLLRKKLMIKFNVRYYQAEFYYSLGDNKKLKIPYFVAIRIMFGLNVSSISSKCECIIGYIYIYIYIQSVRKRLYPSLFFFPRCPVCGEWCKLL